MLSGPGLSLSGRATLGKDLSLHTYVMKELDRWFQSPFKLLQFVSSPVKGSLLFPAYVTS